ncbi:hypothetical protein ACWD4V_13965 [Streptomyces tsukubensis]
MTSIYDGFATRLVARHEDHLLDYGPEEQAANVVKALNRLAPVGLLAPLHEGDLVVDLAGFGKAPVLFVSDEDDYLLLSDLAEALGWPLHKAHAWAEDQNGFAIKDQRDADEKRGDGLLGWERMRDFIDLGIWATVENPDAEPDGLGGRWSHIGDWLISRDRLPLLLSCSPWGKEFMDNTLPAFAHAMRAIHGDKLKNIPTYVDGEPTGRTAYDDLFTTDGLTEEEALRRARRGPVVDFPQDGEPS